MFVRTAIALSSLLVLANVGCTKKKKPTFDTTETTEGRASASSEPGVFADKIVLASTATFTGPNASWGADTWRGSAAYFDELNVQGGVFGRSIKVVAVDDGYETPRALTNLKAFIEKNDFFMLYNFVGSDIMNKTVLELDKHRDKQLMQFASIASTSVFRQGTGSDLAFAVRAPIKLEMKRAVDTFVAAGKKKIAVFHQDDGYGRSGLDGVTAALKDHGLTPVAVTTHGVFQKFEESTAAQIDVMQKAGAEVVFDIGNYQAAAALVRDVRERKWTVPIVNNASINDAFVRTLLAYEKKKGQPIAFNIVGVKVVPSPNETELPLIRRYRELMDRRAPQPPAELTDPNYYPTRFSFQSVEGFVNAHVFVEILKRLGPEPRRERFLEVAHGVRELDIGLGSARVTFAPGDHTALEDVWLYQLKDGEWAPLSDLKETSPAQQLAKKPK